MEVNYIHDFNQNTEKEFLNKPTMGVAKIYLKINEVDFIMPKNKVRAYTRSRCAINLKENLIPVD